MGSDNLPFPVAIALIGIGILAGVIGRKLFPLPRGPMIARRHLLLATGHGTAMAKRVAAAAEQAGADVRARHIAETRDPKASPRIPPGRRISRQPRIFQKRPGMTSWGGCGDLR